MKFPDNFQMREHSWPCRFHITFNYHCGQTIFFVTIEYNNALYNYPLWILLIDHVYRFVFRIFTYNYPPLSLLISNVYWLVYHIYLPVLIIWWNPRCAWVLHTVGATVTRKPAANGMRRCMTFQTSCPEVAWTQSVLRVHKRRQKTNTEINKEK